MGRSEVCCQSGTASKILDIAARRQFTLSPSRHPHHTKLGLLPPPPSFSGTPLIKKQICRSSFVGRSAEEGGLSARALLRQICRSSLVGRSAEEGGLSLLALLRQICRSSLVGRSAEEGGLSAGALLRQICRSLLVGRSADHRLVEEAGGCRPKPFFGRSAKKAEQRRERMTVPECRYMALTSPPRQ